MVPHLRLDALREKLLRAGIAPRHVRRYVGELHAIDFDDLVREETANGASQGVAEITARTRLGSDSDLAAVMLARPDLRSLAARYPLAVFGLGPFVMVLAAIVVGLAAEFIIFKAANVLPPVCFCFLRSHSANRSCSRLLSGIRSLHLCCTARYCGSIVHRRFETSAYRRRGYLSGIAAMCLLLWRIPGNVFLRRRPPRATHRSFRPSAAVLGKAGCSWPLSHRHHCRSCGCGLLVRNTLAGIQARRRSKRL